MPLQHRPPVTANGTDASTVSKIGDGIVGNISVGYKVHRVEVTKRKDQVPVHRVIDWEPMEI